MVPKGLSEAKVLVIDTISISQNKLKFRKNDVNNEKLILGFYVGVTPGVLNNLRNKVIGLCKPYLRKLSGLKY